VGAGDIHPIVPSMTIEPEKQPKVKGPDEDPQPVAVTPAQTPKPPPVQEDPGVIIIETRKPQENGGSESVKAPKEASLNGRSALSSAANTQFLLHRYEPAAKTYEQLIKSGSDTPSVNQRLAQCYSNLGRKKEAADAYKKAISLLESRIANGNGNPTRDRAALEACRQALQVAQGG
jgi:tetratricopeptide (TPR) repeat protein